MCGTVLWKKDGILLAVSLKSEELSAFFYTFLEGKFIQFQSTLLVSFICMCGHCEVRQLFNN